MLRWILRELRKLLERLEISAKESLCCYELKKRKPRFNEGCQN
jgi:hypothetical protein